MRHIVYAQSDTYPIALLIKESALHATEIEQTYTQCLEGKGVNRSDLIIVGLPYKDKNKAPVAFIKEQLELLMPELASVGTKHIYCADANYFKVLTNSKKAEPHLGYALKCNLKGYEHIEVILGINHKALLYDPNNEPKLALSLDTLAQIINGSYEGLGLDIIKNAYYPVGDVAIAEALDSLLIHPRLSCDIETFSLDFDKAGIGTITFCWNQGEGIAFAVDYVPMEPFEGLHGMFVENAGVRSLLKWFFQTYLGRITYHNSSFDIEILIYELWMEDLLDTEGLLTGLECLTARFDDTKTIAYLAVNSTAGNKLSLKELSHEFAGNWAQAEIKDIRKIPLAQLLEYNLIDGLATNYAYDKYYPRMVADQQEDIYRNLMLPSQRLIMQIELTGMPLNPVQVQIAKTDLEIISQGHAQAIQLSPVIQAFNTQLRYDAMTAANAKLKKKVHPIEHFKGVVYNPGSPVQTRKLLYGHMGLPVLDMTKTKQASTKAKHIEKLSNHTQDAEQIAVMEHLMEYALAAKILSTFIPAFELAIDKGDGVVYLHGTFNVGGTVSGRLSSSRP